MLNKNLVVKLHLVAFALAIVVCSCGQKLIPNESISSADKLFPASDLNNKGNWVLNEDFSDEFEGTSLDKEKWFVEGQNDEYYIWKGRPPSQFVPHNALIEDGKLKIRTQWEPDFAFANENYADGNNNDAYGVYEGKPLPITTAAVLSSKRFLYGYMEIKSKVGDAAITGAFWAIGHEQELDIFEQMGNPKVENGDITDTGHKATIHDWSPPATRPTWAYKYKNNNLPFRVADDFHVYGAEWGEDYLKVFLDGVMIDSITQDELGTDWVLNNPMEIWLDSEIFKWLGLPHKEELPVDFEIEYVRVWQKPDNNLLAKQFFGFEGPILFEENKRPLTLLPESSVPDDYQKFWMIDTVSTRYLKINEGDYATGVNSLEFSGFGKNEKFEAEEVSVVSPEGAMDLPLGEFVLSLKVYPEQGRAVKNFYIDFMGTDLSIPIKLEGLEKRKWTTIEKIINISGNSSAYSQMKIVVKAEDVPQIKAAKFYIDDIAIHPLTNFNQAKQN